MNINSKKTFIIVVLCVMLALMGTGFAILSSTLTISGTNSMVGKWDIHIQSITPTTNGLATSNSVTYDTDKLSATLSLNLYEHGDYVEYTVVVQNAGNIPAKLSDIYFENSNNTYVKVTNTAVLNETIAANSTSSFKIKFELVNPNYEEIPEVQDEAYFFALTYVQNTGVTE